MRQSCTPLSSRRLIRKYFGWSCSIKQKGIRVLCGNTIYMYHSALKGGGSLILDKTTPPTLTTAAAAAAFYNNENGRHFAYVFLITISLVAFSHFHYDSGLYTLSHSCSFLSLLLFFLFLSLGYPFPFRRFSLRLARSLVFIIRISGTSSTPTTLRKTCNPFPRWHTATVIQTLRQSSGQPIFII